ncbi:VanZ family protein [Chryseomicrobium palamuruense]|uniref:VanZ family protein n=1 Tax=Chryseomicrobium palamuruense TaxID=682973 RepID=A0ABV8UUI4_9BACL
MKKLTRGALWVTFLIYLAIVIRLVVLKEMDAESAVNNIFEREQPSIWTRNNFTLFETIGLYWNDTRIPWTVRLMNLGGNVVGFIPFGLMLPLLFRHKPYFLLTVIYGFLFSLGLELAQWFMAVGSFDVDDLFLNTIGVIVGYIVFRVLHVIFPIRNYLYSPKINRSS